MENTDNLFPSPNVSSIHMMGRIDPREHLKAEMRVALYVIAQAVADALGPREHPKRPSFKTLVTENTRKKYESIERVSERDQVEARRWILSDEETSGSYLFWCRIADLDPDGARRLLRLAMQGALRLHHLPAVLRRATCR